MNFDYFFNSSILKFVSFFFVSFPSWICDCLKTEFFLDGSFKRLRIRGKKEQQVLDNNVGTVHICYFGNSLCVLPSRYRTSLRGISFMPFLTGIWFKIKFVFENYQNSSLTAKHWHWIWTFSLSQNLPTYSSTFA